jgi:hypothetical protein
MGDHPTSPGAKAYTVVRSDCIGGGHIAHGPFPSYQEAQDWAIAHRGDKPNPFSSWMTIPLHPPAP